MSDVTSSTLLGLGQLEQRLADPEPLCLALLTIEPRSAAEGRPWLPAPALVDAVTDRLREALRPYDELRLLNDGRFAITMPTLAGTGPLHNRMNMLFGVVGAPYELAGAELQVRALLGAAVRTPQEPAADFLVRVVAAVETARAHDGRSPVLI